MTGNATNRLVIVDRDGVINHDSENYIRNVDAWQPIDGSIAALASLHQHGFTVTVATNQSGIGRGYFPRSAVYAMHRKLRRLVRNAGGDIAYIAMCPHHPDAACDCRKPQPGMLKNISRRTHLPLEGAALIGDSARDLEAGAAVGCALWLVGTGNGETTSRALAEQQPAWWSGVRMAPDLAAAAQSLVTGR